MTLQSTRPRAAHSRNRGHVRAILACPVIESCGAVYRIPRRKALNEATCLPTAGVRKQATTQADGTGGRCAALASALARASGETLRPESRKDCLRHELAPMEGSTATEATAADRLANRTLRICSTTRSPLWLALNLETAMMRSVDTCGELTFTVIHRIDIRHPTEFSRLP